MPGEPLRFLHASDLHLERPLSGLAEIPEPLEELLLDAPLQAAARLFEAALVEGVDFVLLSGDVVDPREAGPRALSFLLDQFELLAEQRIAIYWGGGSVDPADAWPAEIALPDNVHRFPADQAKAYVHRRGEQPLAQILGWGVASTAAPPAETHGESGHLFTAAIAHGDVDGGTLAARKQIDYWALGGAHQPRTVLPATPAAWYPGTTQGRMPDEPGPHGALLVQLEHGRKLRTRSVATDLVRWRQERLTLPENSHRNDLQRALRAGMQRVQAEAGGVATLVSWQVTAEGSSAGSLRSGSLKRELVDWLRTEFGRAQPPIWTVGLEIEAATPVAPELYDEDTILGDFLRAVREAEEQPDRPLNLSPFLPELGKQRALAAALRDVDAAQRRELLQAAALLGSELLRGEEALTAGEMRR